MSVKAPSRRALLKGALAVTASAAAITGYVPRVWADARNLTVSFTHNVASGDPLNDRVILWTRCVADQPGDFYLFYLVSERADMRNPVAGGTVLASADNDWCCKVDAAGLQAGRTYYYQFFYRTQRSPIGVTKTAPTGTVANARFAFLSCANHPKGFFNVYREVANRTDLDAVLFLGDYIYEYGPTGYVTFGLSAGRSSVPGVVVTQPRIAQLNPAREIVALSDYRLRYALYRSDTNLQEAHRKFPWMVVWDDHESTNDSWRGGADNHQPATEGDWETRLRTAARVYHEWMPIRPSGDQLRIYRAFDWGNLVRIVMIDTRIEGRDEYATTQNQFLSFYLTARPDGTFPADVVPGTNRTRRMMSAAQETFIGERLTSSTQTWQLIGNQTLLHFQSAPNFADTRVVPPAVRDQLLAGVGQLLAAQTGAPASVAIEQYNQLARAGLPLYDFVADSWAAYPTNRVRFLGQLLTQARNPVVISGDSHNGWAANLRLPTATGIVNVGVEFGTPSVSSPGFEESIIDIPPSIMEPILIESNTNPAQTRVDQLVYCDVSRRGYVVLDFTPERVQAIYNFVSTVFSQTYTASVGRTLTATAGARRITG